MNIPHQLKDAKFVRIEYKTKECKTKWKQPENQIDYDALCAIEKTNYGVVAGNSKLCLIDIDQPNHDKITEIQKLLDETFSVATGKGLHLYYHYTDTLSKNVLSFDDNDKELLSIRTGNSYVIGPGSRHPDGRDYVVVADVPLATITNETLDVIIRILKPPEEIIKADIKPAKMESPSIVDREPPLVISRDATDEAIYHYPVEKVLQHFGISASETIHPIHGSTNGQNLVS